MHAKLFRILFLIAGFLSLGIGVVGIVLPLLPTTPFLLLAAFCFARGSEKFHRWLLQHERLGPPIRDWQERGVIRRGPKILATVMILPGWALLLSRPNIPLLGKAAFTVFLLLILLFLWSRRSE